MKSVFLTLNCPLLALDVFVRRATCLPNIQKIKNFLVAKPPRSATTYCPGKNFGQKALVLATALFPALKLAESEMLSCLIEHDIQRDKWELPKHTARVNQSTVLLARWSTMGLCHMTPVKCGQTYATCVHVCATDFLVAS